MYFLPSLAIGLLASALPNALAHGHSHSHTKLRTVVTTDMEQDDLASLIRYILYVNDIENQGFIYTSSKIHWEGDGKGTEFFLPDREYDTPQTSWRPVGTTTIEDYVLKAYAEVYSNLQSHDAAYPTPEELLSITKVGNVDFEGEMAKDTEGSNLIKKLLLDNDERILYLQAWGGTNTIARALKSIQDEYASTRQWPRMKDFISKKSVILASGLQDETYTDYIAPNWPAIRVQDYSAAWATWGYNCNNGQGNVRGLPYYNEYFQGDWIKPNIQTGPLGSLYRSWLDGQTTPGGGDQLDIFGDPELAPTGWCKPLKPYDFLSEGDNVAYNPLLPTGLEVPDHPALGGWGGRAKQNSTKPDFWSLVDKERAPNGSLVENWTTNRWMGAAQNDFAARMKWTLTPEYSEGNHPPAVEVHGNGTRKAHAGSTVNLNARISDPDEDQVTVKWWQYLEESTYSNQVDIVGKNDTSAAIKVPEDATPGQTISVIVEATDDGEFPLTRYGRVFIQVV